MSGKEHPMLAWARPRRWSILAEAVLAVLLALLALPIASAGGDEAVEIVTGYLEALRDGDVEAANSYIDPEASADVDETWLTGDALSSGWEIVSVERRSAYDDQVHATIADGGETSEGVFDLQGAEGELRIGNPYAYLSVTTGFVDTMELNGHRRDIEAPDDNTLVEVPLFPGSYRLFEGVPALAGDEPASFLAMPDRTLDLNVMLGRELAGDAEAEERLNQDLAAWIDHCVTSTDVAPAGCPFSAQSDFSELSLDGDEFERVEGLAWEVDVYPRVRIDAHLRLVTVSPGWVTLSGHGTDVFGETEGQFAGRCQIEIGSAFPTLLPEGQFEFSTGQGLWNSCHRGLAW